MLLTLTSTAPSATDLGYLLHKHPDRAQSFDVGLGVAHVFYPEASDTRCTVALLLEVDPVGLVRHRRFGGDGFVLAQYVNDRPYAASSLLAVALGTVFGTALSGRCAARPDLEGAVLPLEVHLPCLPSTGGVDLVARLFEPLGWRVRATPVPLDEALAEHGMDWGESRYVDLRLTGRLRLDAALSHLYVLLPVLDGAKHYWVGPAEVDKLLRRSAGWLGAHPERELITRRYLAHQSSYVADAAERLAALDEQVTGDEVLDEGVLGGDGGPGAGEPVPAPGDGVPATSEASAADGASGDGVPGPGQARVHDHRPLALLRRAAVLDALRTAGAARVVDLGCGEGALLGDLLDDQRFTEVVGADVSARELARAERRLRPEAMSDHRRARLTLVQSSAVYRDRRLAGYDAMVLMEVIEHVDPQRLPDLERSVFARARPATVVVTTPNVEFNAHYEQLADGAARHPDHRFEWTRAQFAHWAGAVAAAHGYAVRVRPVGPEDPEVGSPTQLAVFTRADAGNAASAEGAVPAGASAARPPSPAETSAMPAAPPGGTA